MMSCFYYRKSMKTAEQKPRLCSAVSPQGVIRGLKRICLGLLQSQGARSGDQRAKESLWRQRARPPARTAGRTF